MYLRQSEVVGISLFGGLSQQTNTDLNSQDVVTSPHIEC